MKTASPSNKATRSKGFLSALALAVWLAVPALAAGGFQSEVKSPERGAAKTAKSCSNCKDVWEWGLAYWRWGYSPGARDLPSHKNWPGSPYFKPTRKRLCAECKVQYRKRGQNENESSHHGPESPE